ncbi:MAG: marine proteobacterial sortase target protein [Acidobacteria bacterium 13_1_40CM_4_58_4]|nr:MAG: marine proteobacterial sortase target protein [Acidobacteria bacterium 13_1_40CM_4_58_4]
MQIFAEKWINNRAWRRFALVLLAFTTILAGWAPGAQRDDGGTPRVGEGCLLYRSPVSGRYETVPLVHTDVVLDVRGLVVAATVTQQYANNTNEPIEAVYVFPLPHDAAVYDMEIRIGNRVIRSVIREREEAKRAYEAAKSEGKRAALVEGERPNIFTASVANLMPGDHVDVRLRYVESLRWEESHVRLVFPMVVGPRYITGTEAVGHDGTGWAADSDAVPDASRITPPVRNPETRPGHDISLAVDLDAGFEFGAIKSVSHEITVRRLADGRQHIELASGATIPNKDFVLEVQQAESTQPKTALFLSPERDSGETHFLLTAFPPTVQPTKRVPVDMLYLIDVSGSMAGTSIQQAREALLQALDRLRPSDRLGILAFNHSYYEFSSEPLTASPENVEAARRYVHGLEAGGGTEMLPALLHVMRKPETPGYLRHIVLLTDGDLGNEEQIFAALRQALGGARLYTVAIGSAPNFFLATKMAQFGRGSFRHIADISEIREQMGRLLETIESPVLTDVRLSFEGVELAEVYPQRLPDLFLRQPLLIYGRISQGRKGVVHLTARAGDQPFEASFAFDASTASFHPGITTLWARQRVEDLMDRWRVSDEDARANVRASLIAHAIRYRLVTRFTSLLAVEEIVANMGGESRTVAVPAELPAGMQLDKVFGAPATGTADAFLEALGIVLLFTGILLSIVLRRFGQRVGAVS